MNILLWLAIPLIGLMLGLFGAGGGMLTVPILMYGAGLSIKQAVAGSLWIVAAVSIVAAVQQRAWRVLQPRLLAFFAAGGLGGSILGAWLGTRINPVAQQALFAALLFVVAVWMRRVHANATHEPRPCRCGAAVVSGAALGIVTGLLGVGGGFLMVPTLLLLGVGHLPAAVTHSLVLIAVNALVSALTYAGQVTLPGGLIAAMIAVAALGSVAGSHLLYRLPVARLQGLLSLLLAAAGIAMLLHAALR